MSGTAETPIEIGGRTSSDVGGLAECECAIARLLNDIKRSVNHERVPFALCFTSIPNTITRLQHFCDLTRPAGMYDSGDKQTIPAW
jgi:hypothetical protein